MAFDSLSSKLSQAFKKLRGKGRLTPSDIKEAMREVRLSLLEADVNYKVAKDFVASVTERAMGSEVLESLTPAQQVIKIVNEELVSLMGGNEVNGKIAFASKGPTVVMMCGLQGAGKTTHAAKLALHFKNMGKRPLLVACDVYRPAAIDQLVILGEKIGVPVFKKDTKNVVSIAKEAYKHAKDHGNDIVILDTAGRLHIDEELMGELQNIKKALDVNESMLVVDAMTGQDAVNIAGEFNEKIGIDSIILTKLDGDTRGGAALSVLAVTGKAVKFSGIGEKLTDLEVFHPERMASRILGMGDVLTLIEKAEAEFDEKEAKKLEEKLRQNKFDLNDLLDQMRQIKKMGSMKDLLSMIPGVSGKINDADIDERQLDRIEAIILSMTKKEREKPSIINPSRKRRIASGSGMGVPDVNRVLKQYEQMNEMFKRMNKKGKKGHRMPGGFGGGFPGMPF